MPVVLSLHSIAPLAVLCMASAATALTGAPAGAAGILPPSNPPANIGPSSSDWLQAVNTGRAAEGVGPMNVSEPALSALPIDQQMLTVVNEERIDRGLPPISYVTSQLDSIRAGWRQRWH